MQTQVNSSQAGGRRGERGGGLSLPARMCLVLCVLLLVLCLCSSSCCLLGACAVLRNPKYILYLKSLAVHHRRRLSGWEEGEGGCRRGMWASEVPGHAAQARWRGRYQVWWATEERKKGASEAIQGRAAGMGECISGTWEGKEEVKTVNSGYDEGARKFRGPRS